MTAQDSVLERIPDLATIRSTVDRAADDPMLANTEMLGAYYKLSEALGELLHATLPPVNATFATFAAWSAQSLRADIQAAAERQRPSGDRQRRRPARRLYDAATEATLVDSRAIARNISTGQAAIYEEIGSALWVLLSECIGAIKRGNPDWDDVWKRFTTQLVSTLESPRSVNATGPLRKGDIASLQRGFAPYFEVLRRDVSRPGPTRRKKRAELILLGNIRLVAYEQARLQPVLERNLAYLPIALRQHLGARWSGRESPLSHHAVGAYRRARPYMDLLDDAFQIAATRHVYSMIIGAEQLRFGVDIPLPPPAHPLLRADQPEADRKRYAEENFFPYDLQVIQRPDLWSAWQQHDRSDGQGRRTAVDNWLRYPERLNFIVNLFRSRQQMVALYERPSSTPASAPAPVVPAQPALGPVHARLARATEERLGNCFPPTAPAANTATGAAR